MSATELADVLFGVFVAMPIAALSLALISAVYALPLFLIYAWANSGGAN